MCVRALYYQILREFRTQDEESADQWSVVGTRHQRRREDKGPCRSTSSCVYLQPLLASALLRACWSVVPAHLLVQRALLLLCGDELPLHQAHLLLEGVHLAHGRGRCAVRARCGPVCGAWRVASQYTVVSSERVSKTVVGGE